MWAGPSDSFLKNIVGQKGWNVTCEMGLCKDCYLDLVHSCSLLLSLGGKPAAILGAILWKGPDGMDLRKAFSQWPVRTRGLSIVGFEELKPASHHEGQLEADCSPEGPSEDPTTQMTLGWHACERFSGRGIQLSSTTMCDRRCWDDNFCLIHEIGGGILW